MGDAARDRGAHAGARDRLCVLHEPDEQPERPRDAVRPHQGAHDRGDPAQDQVQRRGGHRRGRGGAQGDPRLPARARALPEDGRQDPARRAAGGPSGHGQDPARQGCGRRGGRALLLHLGLGLCRDVRGRRREPRARSLQAGKGGGALDRLCRRDRRRRPPARHGPRRRPRRARADPQSAAGRDGRI